MFRSQMRAGHLLVNRCQAFLASHGATSLPPTILQSLPSDIFSSSPVTYRHRQYQLNYGPHDNFVRNFTTSISEGCKADEFWNNVRSSKSTNVDGNGLKTCFVNNELKSTEQQSKKLVRITNTTSDVVKHAAQLRSSPKYRKAQGHFIVGGVDILREAANLHALVAPSPLLAKTRGRQETGDDSNECPSKGFVGEEEGAASKSLQKKKSFFLVRRLFLLADGGKGSSSEPCPRSDVIERLFESPPGSPPEGRREGRGAMSSSSYTLHSGHFRAAEAAAKELYAAGLRAEQIFLVNDIVMGRLMGVETADQLTVCAEAPLPAAMDLDRLSGAAEEEDVRASSPSFTPTPPPAAAAASSPPISTPLLTHLLVLDSVRDPGNLGTLLRTALALGWSGVFLLPGCCDPLNDKVVRASCGAVLHLPVTHGTLHDLQRLAAAQRLALVCADVDKTSSSYPTTNQRASTTMELTSTSGPTVSVGGGEKRKQSNQPSSPANGGSTTNDASRNGNHLSHLLGTAHPSTGVALVLGNEAHGLSPEVRAACRRVLSVPMAPPALHLDFKSNFLSNSSLDLFSSSFDLGSADEGDALATRSAAGPPPPSRAMESLNVGVAGAILMFCLKQELVLRLATQLNLR